MTVVATRKKPEAEMWVITEPPASDLTDTRTP